MSADLEKTKEQLQDLVSARENLAKQIRISQAALQELDLKIAILKGETEGKASS